MHALILMVNHFALSSTSCPLLDKSAKPKPALKGPPLTWLDISGNGIGHACLAGIKRLRLRGRGRLEVIAIRNASLDDDMFLLLSKVGLGRGWVKVRAERGRLGSLDDNR